MAPSDAPLAGTRVVERARTPAGAYAGRLLAVLGAEVTMAEPPGGTPLRTEPPFLPGGCSALFAYLAAGKRSAVCALDGADGRDALGALLDGADVLIDDTPLVERAAAGLDHEGLARRHPGLVHVSVLPFGADGPKAGWRGEEVNLIHASGEGFLLPNGLAAELFPDRPPLKIHGHFASYQGGTAAALGALSALWMGGGQFVDISVQDAALAVGAFAVQRLGDGSLEHRVARSFKYGGVLECCDGFVEVLTLEERQWEGLVALMGHPAWSREPWVSDPLERGRRGTEINGHVRRWASGQDVAALVAAAQALGVPMARYNTPADVLADPHEQARRLFQPVPVPGEGTPPVLVSPFHLDGAPMRLAGGPPRLGEHGPTQTPAPAQVQAMQGAA